MAFFMEANNYFKHKRCSGTSHDHVYDHKSPHCLFLFRKTSNFDNTTQFLKIVYWNMVYHDDNMLFHVKLSTCAIWIKPMYAFGSYHNLIFGSHIKIMWILCWHPKPLGGPDVHMISKSTRNYYARFSKVLILGDVFVKVLLP